MRFELAKENLVQERGRTSNTPLNEGYRVLSKESCQDGKTDILGYKKLNRFSFDFTFQKEWVYKKEKGG